MTQIVNTTDGPQPLEPDVPLEQLNAGDIVLGPPTDDGAPRATYVVTSALREYRVPHEHRSRPERFFLGTRFERILSGPKVKGILVAARDGRNSRGMFALEDTPTLDRVFAV